MLLKVLKSIFYLWIFTFLITLDVKFLFKMRKIIFLSFFFCFSFSHAQMWCPPGATWYYGYYTWDPWLGGDIGYLKYEYSNDTIINSINVKKIDKYVKTNYMESFYMYADSDKVYIYHNNSFFPLYNFSAQPGDTLIVPGKMDSWYSSWCTDSLGKLTVDSIGTTTINGQTLRYICVSPTPTSQWGYNAKIIEKVGPVSNDMSPFEPTIVNFINCNVVCPSPDQRSFRCYSDNTFGSYSLAASACDFEVSTADNLNMQNFQLFPNPAHELINIEFEAKNSDFITLTIVNQLGQKVYSEIFKTGLGKQQKTISVSKLTKGLYIVRIENNKLSYSNNFLKQ